MISFFRRNSVLLVTGILLLVSGSMLVANSRGSRRIDPLGSVLLEVLSPLDRGLGAMRGAVARVWSSYVDLVGAREEAAWLRKRLREIDQRRESTTDLERENARLQALLDLRDRTPGQGVAARVTSAETKGLFHSATLGKGSRDGIAPGMAVISTYGVVGQVFQASPSAARVLLLEDPSSGIDAIDVRTRARGIVEGGPGDGCKLKYVKRGDEIHVGDELVTSGLDGTFPKGVPLGTITAIVPGERGLFQSAEVKPAVDSSKVEEVLVVAAAPTDLPPDAPRARPTAGSGARNVPQGSSTAPTAATVPNGSTAPTAPQAAAGAREVAPGAVPAAPPAAVAH
ncbi:MAG: rod shape-determining protein MreC [Alphaproteobacteria bacterium]